MLTSEHEAAEVLRHMRLKAYAAHRPRRYNFRWLLELLGWRKPDQIGMPLQAGRE